MSLYFDKILAGKTPTYAFEHFASSKTAIRNALTHFEIPLRGRWRNPYRSHNLPFGKKLEKGRVVDYEREQEVIRSIFKMHEGRLSNLAIARALTAMRTPTKQRRFKWHHEMVRQILLRSRDIESNQLFRMESLVSGLF